MNNTKKTIKWVTLEISSKKIRDTKGTFHAKTGKIKDRNGMDLTEEDIKNWQEYTELYKKDINDPDNNDGVITHLESDILECEVKWVLGSITTNKASGGDGIPIELFQILKDDAVKLLHSICQQIWKTQQWPRTGKGQFSLQSQRKAMPKSAQTTAQLYSSHRLSDFTFTFHFHALEKEMATHCRVLAWRIPWTEEPGRPQSMGLQESDMT